VCLWRPVPHDFSGLTLTGLSAPPPSVAYIIPVKFSNNPIHFTVTFPSKRLALTSTTSFFLPSSSSSSKEGEPVLFSNCLHSTNLPGSGFSSSHNVWLLSIAYLATPFFPFFFHCHKRGFLFRPTSEYDPFVRDGTVPFISSRPFSPKGTDSVPQGILQFPLFTNHFYRPLPPPPPFSTLDSPQWCLLHNPTKYPASP